MAGEPLPAISAKEIVSASAKTSSRKGKPAAPGTKAWSAFVEHCRVTMPERFAPPALPKDRMVIAKAIKLDNPEAYKAFAAKYIAEHPASETASVASDAEQQVSEPIPYRDWGSASATAAAKAAKAAAAAAAAVPAADAKPKRVISDEQKAKMKAGREAAAATRAAAKAAGEPVPAKSKGKAAAAAPAAPAPAALPLVEESNKVKITIEEVQYFMDGETFNLFAIESDGSEGKYAGRYNTEDDTIDLSVGEDE